MDYLVYAYLQSGRDTAAFEVVQELGEMQKLEHRKLQDRIRLHRDADSLRG